MVKYIYNGMVYLDFEYIKNHLNQSRAKSFVLLKAYLRNNQVETVQYKNRILYSEQEVLGLLESAKNNFDA